MYRSFIKLKNSVLEPRNRLKTSHKPKWEKNGILALQMIPSGDFPLFITNKQYLQLLDGTMKNPFFSRRADGRLVSNEDCYEFDLEGIHQCVALDNAASIRQRNSKDQGPRNRRKVPHSLMRQLTYQVCLARNLI